MKKIKIQHINKVNNFIKLLFLWCLLMVLTFCVFLPINMLKFTKSLPNPSILYAYVQNLGSKTAYFDKDDICAFVDSKIVYTVFSEYEITCESANGVDIQVARTSDDLYNVEVSSGAVLSSQIIIRNTLGGYTFANFSFVKSEVDTLSFSTNSNVINATGDNKIRLTYNGRTELIYGGAVVFKLVNNGTEMVLDSTSDIVKKISNNEIVLNFEGVSCSDYCGATLVAVAGDASCELNLNLQNLSKTTTFSVQNSKINYISGNNFVVANVLIDKNSFTTFEVDKFDFIDICKIEKIDTSSEFDRYAITLDISKSHNPSKTTICADTSAGVIKQAVNLKKVDTVSKFVISTHKNSYGPDEEITVSAVLNDDTSLSSQLEWFINGEKFQDSVQLVFKRNQGGNFSVYAVLNGVQSNTLTLNISYKGAELVAWYIIFAVAVVVLALLIFLKRKKRAIYSASSMIERANKFVPRYKLYTENYSKSRFFDLIYDVVNLKDDILMNFKETKNLCFEKASRDLTTAHNILRKIYRLPKEDKKQALLDNFTTFEKSIDDAIYSLNEYHKNNESETPFNYKCKKQKVNK